MLAFKKLITAFLIPPGVFVLLFVVLALWQVRSRRWKQGLATAAAAVLLWLFSTQPVADRLMVGLERPYPLPSHPSGDVIILLGGGVNDTAADLTGRGAPSPDMLTRVVTAVRLQKRLHLPILVSGGAPFTQQIPEAVIVKRFLLDLGVPAERILLEERSCDTVENARFSARICSERRFSHPLLVTSAYHLRRAVVAFRKEGVDVLPFPASFQAEQEPSFHWLQYVPSAGHLLQSSTALKEYVGLLFYSLTL